MTSNNRAEHFMDSPLVAWVKTFDEYNTAENVDDLADGILLHKVMHTVDPVAYSMSKVNRSVSRDPALRIQNLQLLVQRIKHFYLTALQQLVITSLPNIATIATQPDSDYSLDQLEKLLVLLLGCVVQCEGKGFLIENMKTMALSQQQAIVVHIQQVTDTTDYVCSIDWNDLEEISKQNLEGLCRTAYIHLQRVAKERDNHYDTLMEVILERDYYKHLHESQNPNESLVHENGLNVSRSRSTPIKSPSVNPEFIELKKKCRHLQEQLDRKVEVLADLREEVENSKSTVQRLQHEKRELAEDAKSVRVYRDEIETLKVQSTKVEKLEADVVKYRQKAEDTEYLKKRIADLKHQNELMRETKALLEQKADTLTTRSETLDDLQEEHASVRVQMESLQQEKEMDTERIEELLAQNAQLEMDHKHYEEKVAQLNAELEEERERMSASMVSSSGEASNLSFEMSEADLAAKAKVLRLEKEAREMEKSMEALRHAQAKCAELEKTNKKLYSQTHTDRKEIIKLREELEVLKVKASRVDKLQVELNAQRERVEDASRMTAKLKELKTKNEIILETKAKVEDEVENLQSKVALLDHLKDENASLKAQADSHTSKHDEDEKRIQALLEQNAQLELERQRCSEEKEALNAELLQQRNRNGPQAPLTVLSPPRISEGEMASRAKLQRLEKETREMEKSMQALRHTQAKCADLEKTNKKLQGNAHADRKEIIRLKEELHAYKAKTERMEKLQSEMKSQEHQLEDIDGARKKITELKQQNTLLSETNVLIQEEVTSLQNKLEKLSEMEVEYVALKVRIDSLETENQEESIRMQELLQQNAQLELDRDKKNADLETLHSELDQLKLKPPAPKAEVISPVHHAMTEQDLANRTKLLRLERDNRELERRLQILKQSSEKASAEMEKMNKKLTAQIHADKKEIARLKEELRRERSQHAGVTRLKSVSDEQDQQQAKQLQELESKFKDAYSQSLSTKDERIQVLETRVEEMTSDNNQLREELTALRKHNEKLKELLPATNGSPKGSPSTSRALPSREMLRLKEQAAESLRLREKVLTLREDNNHLAGDLMEAKHILQGLEGSNQRLSDRMQMLEQLNHTLDEEKKTLLAQVNKLLEQNQELLVKTLEGKDQAFDDERIFNDRLGELERDKHRLTEQLVAQQREHLSREMDLWKKSKSKNILRKGFKKLKGKIQGRTHVFENDGGSSIGLTGSSQTLSGGSTVSPSAGAYGLGLPPYAIHDESMSSSQSISSSNSGKQSEEQEELEQPDSVGGALVPRAPTMDGSPFLRPRKTRAYTLPGLGPVRMRHGGHPTGVIGSPIVEPERTTDDLMSLEDFLAESEKTPNRRKVMELKRASLVVNTPQETPRDSLLIQPPSVVSSASGNTSQMFDLQEFLSKFEPDSSPDVNPSGSQGSQRQLSKLSLEFRASQQSMSQHSKSNSSSLHSLPSQTSMSNKDGTETGLPVIANPAALAGNFNNNNSNVVSSSTSVPHIVMSNSESTTITDGSTAAGTTTNGDKKRNSVGPTSSTPNNSDAVKREEGASTLSWGDASSIGSRSLSVSSYTGSSDKRKLDAKHQPKLNDESSKKKKGRSYSTSVEGADSKKGRSGKGPKKAGKGKPSMFKRHFYKSSGNILEEPTERKPPLVKRKFHNSAADLLGSERRNSEVIDNLSGLTDLSQKGEIANARLAKKAKKQNRLSLPSWGFAPSTSQESLNNELQNLPTPVPSPTPLDNGGVPLGSDDDDSIWLEYGCV